MTKQQLIEFLKERVSDLMLMHDNSRAAELRFVIKYIEDNLEDEKTEKEQGERNGTVA